VIGRTRARRKPDKRLLTLLRRPAASWFAALILIVQLGLSAAPTAQTASSAERAAALSAAIGQQVSLCAEGDHSGAPDRSRPCCDDCALCGSSPCGAAPIALLRVALLLAPDRDWAGSLVPQAWAAAPSPALRPAARPRAPPVSV